MIVTNFSWKQINQPHSDLKAQFQTNVQKKIVDLNEELNKRSADGTIISSQQAYTVIGILCSKKVACVDKSIQQQFFNSIQVLLNEQQTIFQTVVNFFKTNTYSGSQNDVLINLCFKAIRHGKPQLAQHIIQLISGSISYHHICDALSHGKVFVPFIKDLLENLPEDTLKNYIDRTNTNGGTLLFLAIKFKCEDLIPFLINHGANVDVKDRDGNTPLSLAIGEGLSIKILQELIFHMKNFEFRDREGNNYLLTAIKNKIFKLIPLFIDKVNIYDQNLDGDSALHLVLPFQSVPEALELIEKGADPLLKNKKDQFPFYQALVEKNEALFLGMLDKFDFTKMSSDPIICKAFGKAVVEGFTQAIQKFFDKGFTLSWEKRIKFLELAILKKHEDIAISIVPLEDASNGYEINYKTVQKLFKTALYYKLNRFALRFLNFHFDKKYLFLACRYGSSKFVSNLLKQPKRRIDSSEYKWIIHGLALRDDYHLFLKDVISKCVRLFEKSWLLEKMLRFPTLAKKRAVTALIDIMSQTNPTSETLYQYNRLLLLAVGAMDTYATQLLIEIGAKVDIAHRYNFRIPFGKRILLSFLKEKGKVSASTFKALELTNDNLLWLFNTLLTNPSWGKEIDIEFIEDVFLRLLRKSLSKCDHLLLQNAERVLGTEKVKSIVENFLKSLIKEDRHGCYFDKSLREARKLGQLFPAQASLQVHLQDGSMEVNRFILLASSPVFRRMLSENWKKEDFSLDLPQVCFQKIYDFLANKFLDCSELENEESKKQLLEIFELYQIKPRPVFIPHPDYESWIQKRAIEEFMKEPYRCLNQRELKLHHIFFREDHFFDLPKFLNYFPSIEKLKISLMWGSPISLKFLSEDNLPNLKEVHLNFKHKEHFFDSVKKPTKVFECFLQEAGINLLFFLEGTEKLDTGQLNRFINKLTIGGLDLSNRKQLDIESQYYHRLNKLRYLNLSNTPVDWKQLKELLKATPELEELNLNYSQAISSENLDRLSSRCPALTSIDLQGTAVSAAAVSRFIRNTPHLQNIYLSQLSDAELLTIYHAAENKNFSIYIGKRRVLFDHEFSQQSNLAELTDLASHEELYLLNRDIQHLFEQLFKQIGKGKLPLETGNALFNLLEMLKTKKAQTPHPFILFTQTLPNPADLIPFYLLLAENLQGHLLDEYFTQKEVSHLYRQFCELALSHHLSLEAARKLSKLFSSDAAHEISIDSYSFHPLILMSGGETTRKMCQKIKNCSQNDFEMKSIHAYLQTGKIDLKKINLEHYLRLCQAVENVGLPLDPFLQAAENHEINIGFDSSIPKESFDKFLAHPVLMQHVSVIDLEDALDQQLMSELVNKMNHVKKVCLPARSLNKELWNEFIKHGTEVNLVFNSEEDINHISYPSQQSFEGSMCQIQLTFRGNAQFSTLTEYLTFLKRVPALFEIDLSTFPPCNKPEELHILGELFQTQNPPKSLNLGECDRLTTDEIESIAKCCQGLKMLRISSYNNKTIKQLFNNHTLLDSYSW